MMGELVEGVTGNVTEAVIANVTDNTRRRPIPAESRGRLALHVPTTSLPHPTFLNL